MEIRINVQRLIGDMRNKSHLELANLADPTARYKMEVGTEKLGEIKRDIESAVSTLVQELFRFLNAAPIDIADDDINPESEIVFELSGSSRRFDGKEKAIAQKIHEALVDLTLSKYYLSVSAGDLAKSHEGQAAGSIVEINRMIRQKGVPKLVEP